MKTVDNSLNLEAIELASKLEMPTGHLAKYFAKSRIKKFIASNRFEAFWCPVDEHAVPVPIQQNEKVSFYTKPRQLLTRVKSEPFRLTVSFSDLKDAAQEPFGLELTGTWLVSSLPKFLRKYARERLRCTQCIETNLIESDLVDLLRLTVQEQVLEEDYSFGELSEQEAMSQKWFSINLPRWLEEQFGWLELVKLEKPKFHSPTAEQRKAADFQKRLKESELENRKSQVEHEEKLQQLAHSQEVAKHDRELQILELQKQAQNRELEHEKRKAQLLSEIHRSREGGAAVADEIVESIESLRHQFEDKIGALETAQSQLKDCHQNKANFDRADLGHSKDRISVATSGVSTGTLEILGRRSHAEVLAQAMREKHQSNPDAIMVKKVDVLARDIGTKKVGTLRIGETLTFEFLSRRAGFVSILNIGTSGTITLHAPNAYVKTEATKITAAQRIEVPGDQLIPRSKLLQYLDGYFECGPPGWEEMIVIVSDQPLFDDSDLFSAEPTKPFPVVSQQRTFQLLDQLVDFHEESWDAGVLGFLAID